MKSSPDDSSVPAEIRARIEADPWTRTLGIRFLALGRGFCRLGLTVQPHMVNFQGYPHGRVIFSLADIALGAACNSHGGTAVALSMPIGLLTAMPAGSRLMAEAGRSNRADGQASTR